jgi:hypothetical protein
MVASFSVFAVIAVAEMPLHPGLKISGTIYILAVLSALLCYGGKSGVCCTVQDVYRLQDKNLLKTYIF